MLSPEYKPEDPIDIEEVFSDLESSTFEQQKAEIQQILENKFLPEAYRAQMAQHYFGSATKIESQPDGTTLEVSYTWEDIFNYERKAVDEGYAETKQQMRSQVMCLLETQDEVASQLNGEDREIMIQVRDMTYLLLDRFLAFKDYVDETWPATLVDESYYESYLLEVLRRTAIPTTDQLLWGVGEEGNVDRFIDTFDLNTWQLKFLKNPRPDSDFQTWGDWWRYLDSLTHDDYKDVPIGEALIELDRRQLSEWISTANEEGIHILGYIKKRLERVSRYPQAEHNLRYRKGGERFYSEQEITQQEQRERLLTDIKPELLAIESFGQLMPWLKARFGVDASFETLLAVLADPEYKPLW